MRNTRPFLGLALIATLALNACGSMRSFLSRDLEDEDFIVGKLYADEVVPETPVIAQPVKPESPVTEKAPASTNASGRNPLGLTYDKDDNTLLYETVNSWLGVPYKYGGSDRKGIDCSGFVSMVYRTVYGKTLHRSSSGMLQDVKLISKKDLREGDLLFFTNSKGKVSHVGIYLKEGLFAHSSTSNGVSVSRVDDTYWSKHFYKGGRVK